MIKHSEVWITGLKIKKDEENRMKKRIGINYGRKYAAITLAAVTAACTGATAGSVVTIQIGASPFFRSLDFLMKKRIVK